MAKKKLSRPQKRKSSRSSFYYNLNKFLTFLIVVLSIATIVVNQKPVAKPQVLSVRTVAVKISPTTTENQIQSSPIPALKSGAAGPTSSSIPIKSVPTTKPAQPIVMVPQVQAATTDSFCLTVPVLLYHHIQPMDQAYQNGNQNLTVTPEYFEMQMRYLSENGYTAIPEHELVDALMQRRQMPEKTIIVTLDDAYADAFTYAFPVFQKHNVTGNIMVPTGLIQGADYLTWEQLREMTGSGLIFAYNHTWSHASLPNIPVEQIEQEILTAQQQLASQIGKSYPLITYPYGTYDENVFAILRKHGFQGGFSTIHGTRQCDSDLMHLYRTHIGNADLSYYSL